MAKLNLVGQRFGELTVIADSSKRSSDGCVLWQCECTCGEKNYLVNTSELRRTGARAKKHCGSSIHQINNLIGQTFGNLEVIQLDKESLGTRKIKWFCKCHKCNREDLVSIRGNDLLSGQSQSCGCGKSFSRGAEKILNILLNEYPQKVLTEYSFDDLISPTTNTVLRFDFYIKSLNILIEYDGEQHFYYSNGNKTWNTKEKYERTKIHDTLKNNYCINHNIPLYRIPYTDIDTINIITDIIQDKYLIQYKIAK